MSDKYKFRSTCQLMTSKEYNVEMIVAYVCMTIRIYNGLLLSLKRKEILPFVWSHLYI